MKLSRKTKEKTTICETQLQSKTHFRDQLSKVVENIVKSCYDEECFNHIDAELLPSRESIVEILNGLREILFPGYFNKEKTEKKNLTFQLGRSIDFLFSLLSEQITRSFRHECLRYDQPCVECVTLGYKEALSFLESIPEIRKVLAFDVRAAYNGDPAAKSYDEIVFSYPGIFAITVYRIAHQLFLQGIPLIPRIMTEYAHNLTGIDIHPGAEIKEGCFIDHGTGVVIGETTVIGKNVRIYQGVTLGALSIPNDACDRLRGKKRHPTIEDDVIIYAEATILGGETRIGARSVLGGNVWITESVPQGTKVFLEGQKLIYKEEI